MNKRYLKKPSEFNKAPVVKVKDEAYKVINGMGCTSFRLMFDDCDWEDINDNNDPNIYNYLYLHW